MDYSSKRVLFLDKKNFLGSKLNRYLQGKASLILVTSESIVDDSGVVVVPFGHPIPQIPDADYMCFVFVWGQEEDHLVEPLSRRAAEQKIPFFILFTHEQQEKVRQYQNIATLLELGDLFGTQNKQPLDTFLQGAKAKKQVVLSNMGMHIWHPVFFMDAVEKVAEIVLEYRKGKPLFIGPPHGVTALGLVRCIQKIDPDIVVDFSKEEKEEEGDHLLSGVSAMLHYDSITAIRRHYIRIQERQERKTEQGIGNIVLTREKQTRQKKQRGIIYVVYVLLILLFLPFVIMVIFQALGAVFLSSGIREMEKGAFVKAEQKIAASRVNFTVAKDSASLISDVFPLLNTLSYFTLFKKQVILGDTLSQIARNGIDAGQKLSGILSGKTTSPQSDSEQAVSDLKQMQLLVLTIQLSDVPKKYRLLLETVQKIATMTSGLVEELPQLLGVKGDKVYLVLFLNNMELRPGGGFIGSYGLLHLKNGAIKDFAVHDVYDADGQLKGHVEPPFAIRRYIPIVHLYLRDSNFDPDFSNDAKIAASFLSQETGVTVDGVFGIDLNAFQNIIKAIGSVYIPSYNQTVTDANFFQILEGHAEKNSFPGSTQKKDFLKSVASALLTKLQSKQSLNGQSLLEGIVSSLQKKHIVMSFADPTLQKPFSLVNLSGTLPQESASGGIHDFFGIVEANLGINKANAFIKRQLAKQITVAKNGDIVSTVLLTLTNSSDGSWPGGPYKNYLRFILPKNAVLNSVDFNGVEQTIVPAVTNPAQYEATSFVAPLGLEVAKETEGGKALYGFLVTVPIQKSLSIKITYTLQKEFALNQLGQTYNLLLWKQVGVSPFPYNMTIKIPDSYRLLTSSVPFTLQNQELSYSGLLESDTAFSLSFAKK